MDYESLRKWILRSFKLHGLSVRADAVAYLAEQLLSTPKENLDKSLEKIVDQIQLLNLESLVIDKEQIEHCFKESLQDKHSSETVWNVIDVFKCPRFIYNREKCKYEKDDSVFEKGLFSDAPSKSFMKRRFHHNQLPLKATHCLGLCVYGWEHKTYQFVFFKLYPFYHTFGSNTVEIQGAPLPAKVIIPKINLLKRKNVSFKLLLKWFLPQSV